MLHILIDTSVWLDLAKDYRQLAALACLETLVDEGQAVVVLPQIVVEEFARNKDRVARESRQGLTNLFRRMRDTVEQFGDDIDKVDFIARLQELDHRASTRSGAANDAMVRIEALFAKCVVEPSSDAVKLLAAARALDHRAPFHRQRNSMADAILIEHYDEATNGLVWPDRSAFVTHNIRDFSSANGDSREPHADLASYFDGHSSTYATSLAEILGEYAPELLDEIRFETEWSEQSRRLSDILAAMDEFHDKIWYGRHWGWRKAVEEDRSKIVDDARLPPDWREKGMVERRIYEGAVAAATKIEAKFPRELGPWTDFEWGMLNGKLSALRWVLGDEWDMLDT